MYNETRCRLAVSELFGSTDTFFTRIGGLVELLEYPRLKFKIHLISRKGSNLVGSFSSFALRDPVSALYQIFENLHSHLSPPPYLRHLFSPSLPLPPVLEKSPSSRTSRMNTSLFFPRYRFELQNNVREQKRRSSQQQPEHRRELREKLVLGRPRGGLAV